MTASLRALLTGVIDYAGLFPPAKLPLDAALAQFLEGRAGRDAWMLARLVVPAARLGELASHEATLAAEEGTPLALIARTGADAPALLAGLDRDIGDLEGFLERHGSAVRVEALELKIPAGLLEPQRTEELEQLFEGAAELIRTKSPAPLQLFWEGSYGPDWNRAIKTAVATLAEHRRRRIEAGDDLPPGFKLRCGGADSSAIPPVEQVALVIAECRDAGVPFKATAGLHHAVRHLDHELLAKAHGFLNVFGAAALAHGRGLDEVLLAEVLADEDPAAFVFDDDRFRWREHEVSVTEIQAARRDLACSFGSCSFDEPRNDLRALGLFG